MTLLSLYILTTISVSFMFFTTPLMLACLVISTATMLSMFLYSITMTSWMPFILFMIFITAMMVIFVYVASLTSNEFLLTYPSLPLLMAPAFTFIFFFKESLYLNDLIPSLNLQTLAEPSLTPFLMSKIYAPYIFSLSLLLISYLLIVLIVVAKNSTSVKGPLRAYL